MAIDIIARGMIEESSGDVGQLSEKVNSHIENSDIHVTTVDKNKWNGYSTEITQNKTDISQLFDITKGGETVGGESSYTLKNAVDYPLLGLNLYGKSTQDGTPTPDNPVEIVSVGDGGSVAVQACGKNLLNYDAWKTVGVTNGTAIFENNGISITATENDAQTYYRYNVFPKLARVFVIKGETITLSWEESTNTSGLVFIFPNGKEDGLVRCNNSLQKKLTYTVPSGVSFITFRFGVSTAGDTISYKNIMIERGYEATEFEPYKGSTATITSALPLCGIPVDSGGNYTDSNGQQWICDELIYNADGTGKIIKRVREYEIKSTDTYVISSYSSDERLCLFYQIPEIKMESGIVLSNRFETVGYKDLSVVNGVYNYAQAINFSISTKIANTVEGWKSFIETNPTTVVYILAEPQEIELTAAEMSTLRQLQTFNGITNVSNDGGADMGVTYCTNKVLSEYVMPITTGLQSQIDELKAAVLSLGGNV